MPEDGATSTLQGVRLVRGIDVNGDSVNFATEETLSQIVMAVNNAIDSTAFDLNAAAFSEITSISNDFIFDSIELNFSTAEAKTITITSSDGTILWGGAIDTTAANQGYLSTARNIYLEFNRGFVGNDNITVDVTQLASPGTMDCILKTRSGSNTLIGNPHVGWVDTDGTERGFENVDGRPRVSTVNYETEISKGALAGHSHLYGFGERMSIGTDATGNDVWHGTAIRIPHPEAVSGEQMSVVSTSGQDGVAGTGILTIRIEYIDSAGVEQVEDITMNGLTPVNTSATDITFVNHMFTTSVGSSGSAVGLIDIYKLGDATTVYNNIIIGGNKSLSCILRVPDNKTFFLTEWHCSVTGNKPTAMRLRSTDWSNILYNGNDPVFLFKDTAYLGENEFDRDFNPPIRMPGGTTIKITGWASQATTGVSGAINGYYE